MQRRQGAERAGVADEDVEAAPATVERLAEPVDRRVIAEIAGNQGRGILGLRPQCADRVVELFERALGSRQGDDMGARGGEGERDGSADAARRARYERDPAGGCFGRRTHAFS